MKSEYFDAKNKMKNYAMEEIDTTFCHLLFETGIELDESFAIQIEELIENYNNKSINLANLCDNIKKLMNSYMEEEKELSAWSNAKLKLFEMFRKSK